MKILTQAKKDNYKPNKKLLSYCEQFKTIDNFRKFIIEKEKCPDYIAIADIPFTMEEYDMEGKIIVYKNKKLMLDIVVNHINRYKDFRFVKDVYAEKACSWREDITYLE